MTLPLRSPGRDVRLYTVEEGDGFRLSLPLVNFQMLFTQQSLKKHAQDMPWRAQHVHALVCSSFALREFSHAKAVYLYQHIDLT